MNWPTFHFDAGTDLFPMLAGTLAAVACGVLGNFLVLRRLSLMGDAISHSVLPGLVIAFLIASTRAPLAMFLGAAIAGMLTVVLVELVKRLGRVEPGAAMGVVFSVLFAVGVLLIEKAAVRHVDLDADCVLHGQLETLAWYTAPDTLGELFRWSTFEAVPRQVIVLAIAAAMAIGFVAFLFKELRIAAFDPQLATTQGFNATALHYALMVFVAAATVASFEAVGSILVIAMLVCPAATARLLTDRLRTQVGWSIAIAIVTAVGGYVAATAVPSIWGKDSVNAAGSMTVVAGGLLTLAIVASPRHGVLSRVLRRRKLSVGVVSDDVLAALFRAAEAGQRTVGTRALKHILTGRSVEVGVGAAVKSGWVVREGDSVALTDEGLVAAGNVVRRHRLWETYLVDRAGVSPDHVHETAEQLEHLKTAPPPGPTTDPHGRSIPAGTNSDDRSDG
jgi:manganese/zinc/iron transport system permease protein